MDKVHYCNSCDYKTDRLSSYKKHLTTTKHQINEMNDMANKFNCQYCNKVFLKKNKIRHIDLCKKKYEKHIVDTKSNEKKTMLTENEINNILEKFIEKIRNDVPPQQITNNVVTNNIVANIDKYINYNYVVQNFTDPYTIEECINAPLTKKEQKYILSTTPAIGCEYFIKKRCIDDLPIEKRPFHCLDLSRNKFAIYTSVKKNNNCDKKKGEIIKKRWVTKMGNGVSKHAFNRIGNIHREWNENEHDGSDEDRITMCDVAIGEMYQLSGTIQRNIGEASLLKNNIEFNDVEKNVIAAKKAPKKPAKKYERKKLEDSDEMPNKLKYKGYKIIETEDDISNENAITNESSL